LKTVLESPEDHERFISTAKTVIIVGIVIGMYFVHCGGIIHRDLKPANVLLDPISHYPKIADFGVSRPANVNTSKGEARSNPLSLAPGLDKTMAMTGQIGSPLYMAPEIIAGRSYSSKADVFSFGVLLYEIVTGKQPCQDCGDCSIFHFYEKVISGARETIPETVEAFTAALIRRCWDDDPHKRPTFLEIFDELQEHHFKIFSVVDPEAVDEFLQSLS
jgi:serine/threonine protein kinase